ncbi:MAG: flagellar basal body L-ring protein FlgH [Planctomycetes bacterium]|nr:flagellar basal body L-ring protein FlgH [Planctomycetota bacterium]
MRSNKWIRVVAVPLLMLGQASVVFAGSIWAQKGINARDGYADDVAAKIGDVLTIKISETSNANNKVERDLSKSTDKAAAFDGNLGIVTNNHNILPRMPAVNVAATSSNTLAGSSEYKENRTFSDTITVVVQDVQPNGNLVVMGRRERDIAEDIQIVEVTGIVRPSDIAFDNTITSGQVANFCLSTTVKGVSKRYNKQGWLGNFFDILWPF